MNPLQRIKLLFKRRKRAKKLGFTYKRGANFEMPEFIKINSNVHKLLYKKEDPSTVFVFIENIIDDCYYIEEIKHPVKTAIDIGGNMGFSSLKIKTEFPRAMVHCYEPNPENEPYLKAQSQAAGFVYFMEAVGAKDGKVNLFADTNASAVASTIEDEEGEILQTSFKKVIERLKSETVDFVKMDCEGAEWEILQDSESWQKVKTLAMEYHLDLKSDRTFEKITKIVEKLNFTIYKHIQLEPLTGLLFCTRM